MFMQQSQILVEFIQLPNLSYNPVKIFSDTKVVTFRFFD
ncbi:hypothetical protein J559_3274 [Acinetobacter sp. 983759]|nr:hypothetical protein J559_3274 [Acinetobacter sp. 983759]